MNFYKKPLMSSNFRPKKRPLSTKSVYDYRVNPSNMQNNDQNKALKLDQDENCPPDSKNSLVDKQNSVVEVNAWNLVSDLNV